MATTTELGRVRERSTGTYVATLRDEAGVVIPLASLTTLTLSLYNVKDKTILNSRNAQNVLNTNNVTYHATSGLLTWSVQPADHAIVGTGAQALEQHRGVFRYTWGSGKADWHAIEFLVDEEPKVT